MAIVLDYGYRPIRIDGDSMAKTYIDGDKFLVNKVVFKFNSPERGDVVVFYDWEEDSFLVKRVIGMPYDTVEVIAGVIFINDMPLIDEFSHLIVGRAISDVFIYTSKNTLKEGEYWCIGDNREATWFGIVREDEILGLVD